MNRLALKVHASRRGTIFFLRCQQRGATALRQRRSQTGENPTNQSGLHGSLSLESKVKDLHKLEDGYDPKQGEERDIRASDQESIGLKKNKNADRDQPEKTGEKPAKDDAMGAIPSRRP
ncbi:hypothetical protein DY000_02035559 [Brassica cretica]|uniref:Uncharacterized protein n=1 Tax=Brassica cretica TaxID=69181 RepID=A0ABQ7DRX1_BRACR|nr:hypothetical protein DY000_02035559 [Brassica cretica]